MKNKLIVLFCACTLPVFAGSTAPQVTSGPAPVPQPSLWSWFVGGSAGYLLDTEEFMYSAQFGVDTPWNVGGWQVALFGEVGYTEVDDTFNGILTGSVGGPRPFTANVETDITPFTVNVKLERPLTGGLSAYFGAGAGAALVDFTTTYSLFGASFSDDDTVFVGQIFAGLTYNFSPACELYGGARWIYLDDATIFGDDLELDDDVLLELGLRVNF